MELSEIKKISKEAEATKEERVRIAKELWGGPVMARILEAAMAGRTRTSFRQAPSPVLHELATLAKAWGATRATVAHDKFGPGQVLLLDWAEPETEGDK